MRLSSSGIKYTKPYTTTGVFAPPKPFLEIFFSEPQRTTYQFLHFISVSKEQGPRHTCEPLLPR